jgi:hypothetical protein
MGVVRRGFLSTYSDCMCILSPNSHTWVRERLILINSDVIRITKVIHVLSSFLSTKHNIDEHRTDTLMGFLSKSVTSSDCEFKEQFLIHM